MSDCLSVSACAFVCQCVCDRVALNDVFILVEWKANKDWWEVENVDTNERGWVPSPTRCDDPTTAMHSVFLLLLLLLHFRSLGFIQPHPFPLPLYLFFIREPLLLAVPAQVAQAARPRVPRKWRVRGIERRCCKGWTEEAQQIISIRKVHLSLLLPLLLFSFSLPFFGERQITSTTFTLAATV